MIQNNKSRKGEGIFRMLSPLYKKLIIVIMLNIWFQILIFNIYSYLYTNNCCTELFNIAWIIEMILYWKKIVLLSTFIILMANFFSYTHACSSLADSYEPKAKHQGPLSNTYTFPIPFIKRFVHKINSLSEPKGVYTF